MRHPLLIGLMLAAGSGCENLLDVPGPPLVPPSTLDDPRLATTLVQGVVADFECALASYIVATALLTDEFRSASTSGFVTPWDNRTAVGSGGGIGCEPGINFNLGVYAPLSTARYQADDALRRLRTFDSLLVPPPGKRVLVAAASAYAGYAYTIMGEGFCEAAFDLGPALDWHEVLAIAEQRFDTALQYAQAAPDTSLIYLAHVGRARVRLNLGDLAGAASDARAVMDPAFVTHATYSIANRRRENRVYESNDFVSVDTGFRDLRVMDVPDPRVSVVDAGRTGGNGEPVWIQQKYASASTPIVVASWREAQLIIAEAEGGQSAVSRINALRASYPTLPLFSSTDSTEIARQLLDERRRELFLDGHRLNDILRFGIPFPPASGDVTCLRLPRIESDNNPNIEGTRTTRDSM